MSNSFYNHGSFPTTGSSATSASMRAELDLVGAAFDKMPTLSGGNANMFVLVNSVGTALTASSTLPSLTVNDTFFVVQDDADNTRKFRFEATSITPGATRILTVPDADLTIVGTATTQTLTNKTLGAFTISGTVSGGGNQINNVIIGTSTPLSGAFTTLTSNGATTFTAGTASTTTGTGTLVITGGLGVSGRINAANFDGIVGANTAAAGSFTTLSATGATTLSAQLTASTGDGTYPIISKDTRAFSVGVTGPQLGFFGLDSTSTNNSLGAFRALAQSSQNGTLEARVLSSGSITTIGTFSSTGLAVTGALSATGTVGSTGNAAFGGGSVPVASGFQYGIGVGPNGLIGTRSASNDYRLLIGTNQKLDGTYRSTTSQPVSVMTMDNGITSFSIGPAGTADNAITFTQAMTLDVSGNLGVGVTPSANAGQRTLSIANYTGTFSSLTMGGNGTAAGYVGYNMGNTSTNTAWRYLTADTGSALWFAGNELRFMLFPLGTAGATTSGTQAMTLDVSGNLGIGTTSPAVKLQVNGSGQILRVTDGTTGASIYSAGGLFGFNNQTGEDGMFGSTTSHYISIVTNGGERARIDSAGNLGLGVTPVSQNGKVFHIDGGTGAADIRLTNNATGSAINNGGLLTLSGSDIYFWNLENNILSFGTSNQERARIDSSGRLLVGLTSSLNAAGAVQLGGFVDTRVVIDSSSTQGIFFTKSGADNGTFRVDGSGNYNWIVKGASTANMTLDVSGNLLVGKTSAGNSINGAQLSSTYQYFTNTSDYISIFNRRGTDGISIYFQKAETNVGTISVTTVATTFNSLSDYRLKNITGALTGAKDFIMSLQPKQGTWKTNGFKFVGFLAHEFQEVSPSSVTGEKDAVDADGKPIMQSMQASSSEVMANLVAFVQELKAEFDAYKASHP